MNEFTEYCGIYIHKVCKYVKIRIVPADDVSRAVCTIKKYALSKIKFF